MAAKYWINKVGSRYKVRWWTDDNLEEGFPSEQAEAEHFFPTIGEAYGFVRGNFGDQSPITHSWYGWMYNEPVRVYVKGKLLPFDDGGNVER